MKFLKLLFAFIILPHLLFSEGGVQPIFGIQTTFAKNKLYPSIYVEKPIGLKTSIKCSFGGYNLGHFSLTESSFENNSFVLYTPYFITLDKKYDKTTYFESKYKGLSTKIYYSYYFSPQNKIAATGLYFGVALGYFLIKDNYTIKHTLGSTSNQDSGSYRFQTLSAGSYLGYQYPITKKIYLNIFGEVVFYYPFYIDLRPNSSYTYTTLNPFVGVKYEGTICIGLKL